MRASLFSASLAVVMTVFLALPAAAQTTTTDQQHSPVYSGIANMLGGSDNSGAAPAQPAQKAEEKRPQTREEYRAARAARKEAEKLKGPPLPKDVFYDETTGQYKKVISGKSGGKYITSTTCYEVTLQTESTRVMRPVACIMPPKVKD